MRDAGKYILYFSHPPQDLESKLKDATASEAKLQDINAELNTKMAEMVDDFDRDKKAALDR